MTMTSGYDFSTIYGQADHSGGLIDGGTYAAVIESSEYGRTKDGTKGQWTVKTRITDPVSPYLGRQLTGNITISPENPTATGIMFRHLGALGVPVPDPKNPAMVMNGQVPFWINPQTGQPLPNDGTPERIVAQMMTGKPVLIRVIVNEWDGGTNNKIKDWTANPGGPVAWPQTQGSQAGFQTQPFGQPGYGQPAYPPQPGYPPQGYGPPAQPGYPPQPGYPGAPAPGPQQPAQQAPAPWQNVSGQMSQPPAQPAQAPPPWAPQPPQQPAFEGQGYGQGFGQPQPPQGQPPVQGAPAWAQPPVPGQGGGGEFTPQGMSQQPGITPAPQPPWAQQPQQPPQAQPAAAYPPAGYGQPNGYPQQPQQPQQGQPQQPGEAPPVPPWAQ
jgi:hypothetical protein